MVRKGGFDSEGVLTWSVFTFVSIIDPHTSTATTCFRSPERERASLAEGGKWDDNPVLAELYDLCSTTPRTPNWEKPMGREEQMGSDSHRWWFTS